MPNRNLFPWMKFFLLLLYLLLVIKMPLKTSHEKELVLDADIREFCIGILIQLLFRCHLLWNSLLHKSLCYIYFLQVNEFVSLFEKKECHYSNLPNSKWTRKKWWQNIYQSKMKMNTTEQGLGKNWRPFWGSCFSLAFVWDMHLESDESAAGSLALCLPQNWHNGTVILCSFR